MQLFEFFCAVITIAFPHLIPHPLALILGLLGWIAAWMRFLAVVWMLFLLFCSVCFVAFGFAEEADCNAVND
jgi:hypothetical protein